MDRTPARPTVQSMQRPQVFVKVEFGVSWSSQHAPRAHAYEYRSRAMKERAPNFPRQVAAPTTNYLDASWQQEFQQSQVPQFYYRAPTEQQQQPSLVPEPDYHQQGNWTRQVVLVPEPDFAVPQRRPSRAERTTPLARHERGRSAPPPLSDNHWDVVGQETAAEAMNGSSTVVGAAHQNPHLWKALPELPNRYRLDDQDVPWEETWSIPPGFEPYIEPEPLEQVGRGAGHDGRKSPVSGKIESPMHSPRARGDESARRRELEALGSAMMTVDNGFEHQWWNQGQREVMPLAVAPPPTTNDQVREQMALGWTAAILPSESEFQSLTWTGDESDVASPEAAGSVPSNVVVSPVSSNSMPEPQLRRSLSTRSDELWITRERYA